jgi:hypothetical protein
MIDSLPALTAAGAQPDAGAVVPDRGDESPRVSALTASDPIGFGSLLDSLNAGGAALERAEAAENAFAAGTGGLQEMVFERAKADSIVSVAAAASSRVAQSLNTLVQMQL